MSNTAHLRSLRLQSESVLWPASTCVSGTVYVTRPEPNLAQSGQMHVHSSLRIVAYEHHTNRHFVIRLADAVSWCKSLGRAKWTCRKCFLLQLTVFCKTARLCMRHLFPGATSNCALVTSFPDLAWTFLKHDRFVLIKILKSSDKVGHQNVSPYIPAGRCVYGSHWLLRPWFGRPEDALEQILVGILWHTSNWQFRQLRAHEAFYPTLHFSLQSSQA